MIFIVFQKFCFQANAANTYYVSPQGSNSNSGQYSAPFQTIQFACDKLQAGDTLNIMAGTYNENVTINVSGTVAAPITIQNNPNEFPAIDGTGKTVPSDEAIAALLLITNKNYIKIKGLEIRNYSASSTAIVPAGIRVRGTSTGVEIRNCKVHDIKNTNTSQSANAHGIAVHGTNSTTSLSGLVLEGNEVYNCVLGQSETIVLNGNVENFKVNNNIIHDNNNIGIDFIGYEGTATGEADRARNGECIGNTVYNISSKNNPSYGGDICADGIYVDGGRNILIDKNKVYNCDIGIEAASEHQGKATDSIIIRNNLVYNCKGYCGISFGGSSGSNGVATNIIIVNNTLYGNSSNIVIQNANSSTNIVKNNILNNSSSNIEGAIGSNVFSNNIENDAMFVNPSTFDFHLKDGSPAINAGVVLNYGNTALDNKPRVVGTAVDCGAYEFQASLPVSVTGVTLLPSALTVDINTITTPFSVAIAPLNATNQNCTFSSSNPSIASVDSSTGVVSAMTVGTVVMTVKTVDGGYTANSNVTVNIVNIPVTGVTLSKTSLSLLVGGNSTLTATVSPTNATNRTVSFSSSNPSVATVDNTGKVVAVSAGTAVITATAGGKSATCSVTSTSPPTTIPVTSIALSQTSLAMIVRTNTILTTTVSPTNATNRTVSFTSSNPSVATVDNTGKVVAVVSGTAVINATTVDGSKTAYCNVTVSSTPSTNLTISNVTSSSITTNSAVIKWTTNVVSDSTVEYGTTTLYGMTTVLDTTMVTSHSKTLSNLSANTTYHFRVISKNASGVITKSSDFLFTAAKTAENVRLVMVSYGNHDAAYDSRILAIKPEYCIDNPPHGLWGEKAHQQSGYDYGAISWILQNVSGYQAAGIKVLGYLSGGYENSYADYWYSLDLNKMLITNMADIDRVNGVFIDECSNFPNATSKAYLTELSNLAHSKGLVVWVNPGTNDFDPWYFTSGVADMVMSSENWLGVNHAALTTVQQTYGSKIAVTGWKYPDGSSVNNATDAYNMTINAWQKGIHYCYINNAEYTTIAPWFEEYVTMLRNYQSTPQSVPVSSVTLSQSSITINTGSSANITATVNPSNATNKAVAFSSSNPSVATVDNTGKVVALSAGTAVITATADGKSAACNITSISSSTTIDDGNTLAQATKLQLNIVKDASILSTSDRDWFKFTTTTSGNYKIQTFGKIVDTWGQLFNNTGRVIASNDDGGGNGNFLISRSLAANTTYYVYVDGNKIGAYSIKVWKQ